MKNYIYIALVALLITSGFFTTAHAQGDLTYTPLEPIAGLTQGNTNVSVPELLNAVFKILFSLGALLAVFMLVLGGISYMASSIPGVKKMGLDRARAALFGLLILAGSYLILNTINPELVKLTFIVPAGGNFVTPDGNKGDISNNNATCSTNENSFQSFSIYPKMQTTKSIQECFDRCTNSPGSIKTLGNGVDPNGHEYTDYRCVGANCTGPNCI